MPRKDPEQSRVYGRAWHAANREKDNARKAAYYQANKESIRAKERARNSTEEGRAKNAARQRKWRASNPERSREIANGWKRRNGYKSMAAYNRRMERIAGRKRPHICDVCGRGGKIVFDHCHSADRHPRDRSHEALNRFRGWLCDRCNVALGMVDNNPEILRQLIDYLVRER